jgi:uncharacterized membrane protein
MAALAPRTPPWQRGGVFLCAYFDFPANFHLGLTMQKGRLEAFSDGVLAIILTIMVLELKVPHGADFSALKPLLPVFLSYVLSFVYVGIYWNNHHHLLSSAQQINGSVLWPNLHLLFWLSLVPISTGWMGENHFAPATLAVYGAILLASAVAYSILQNRLIALNGGPDSSLAQAVGRDWKGKLSPVLYLVGIVSSFVLPWLAGAVYVAVALMWLVPDRRIERTLHASSKS